MNPVKIVILNAPPKSGKDYLAYHLQASHHLLKLKFATRLKLMTHQLYGLFYSKADEFETTKDEPNPLFFGLTPRQAYINVSESYIKPVHGKDFFGKVLVKDIQEIHTYNRNHFVISDGGFLEEVMPLVKAFGKENLLVLQIHNKANKLNNPFEGDSRDWLNVDGVKTLTTVNNLDSKFLIENTQTIFSFFNS